VHKFWVVPAAVACTIAGVMVPAAPSSAGVRGDRTMLVFFRHSSAGSHAVLATDRQAAVLDRLTALGASVLIRDTALGAATVRATPSQLRFLRTDPLVASVLANTLVPGPPSLPTPSLRASTGSSGIPAHAPCGTATKPQLNPEALGNIRAVGGDTEGYDGAGVKVAFLADGYDPANPDLARNAAFATSATPAGSRVGVSVNFGGDPTSAPTGGAEGMGDAASIAAQGNKVYNLSSFVGDAHPLPANCDIRIQGDAPGASLLGLNVFGLRNSATASAIVEGIDYAVAHGASVINESFGFNDFPDTSVDIIRQADEAAVAAGVTVVVSSGDAGIDNTMGVPSTDPAVLAVGATTTYRAYAQLTYGGINALSPTAGYLDNNISAFSSGGIGQDGKTVSLVAPGDLGWSLCATPRRFEDCGGLDMQLFGGTSESAPLTSGAAADVIEAYERSHGGVAPTPSLVMQILTSTAQDVAAPAVQQGAGLLDVAAAVRLATSIQGTTLANPPGGVLTSPQVNLVGDPNSAQTSSIGLTNTSSSPTTVELSTRTLVPARTNHGTTLVKVAKNSPDPHFRDSGGFENVYQRGTFTVAPGTARVQLQAAFGAAQGFGFLEASLFSPSGQLAAYSIPQGISNYADLEVAKPQAGRWTVVFFDQADGGPDMVVTVHWMETNLDFATEGTVTPGSVVLAPGESMSVSLDVTMPSTPGDSGFSVLVDDGATRATIPVTLRTVIPLGSHGGRFSGLLTGGNGRGGAPGQANTYVFDVPQAKRDLDVGIAMASNPVSRHILLGDEFGAFLIDPAGQTVAYNVNASFTDKPPVGLSYSRFCNLYVVAPQAGRWQLEMLWFQPLDGWSTSVPFTGSVEFNTVSVSSNLPDAASAHVPTKGAAFEVHVHNTGVAPILLSPDARLPGVTSMGLRSLFLGPLQPLPGAFDAFYVPTETQSINVRQSSNVPATFQFEGYEGDPLLSPATTAPYETSFASPTYSTLTYSPPGGTAPGLWVMASDGLGPYPSSGEQRGYVILDVHVEAAPFDPGVRTTATDLMRYFTTGIGSVSFNHLPYLAAGASKTFNVRIDPTRPAGAVVSGTLYLNDALPELCPQTVAAIPYEYTVGH
jgi:Subtilase family